MNAPTYELGDWFSNNIPNWELWLAPLKGQSFWAIEIGSCEGRSAIWLLENILTHPSSRLHCCDVHIRDRFIENLHAADVAERVWLSENTSWKFLQHWGAEFELIYIDGSHHAKHVLEDSINAWHALKPGGILIWDDYRLIEANDWNRPGPAIDAFLSAYRLELDLLPEAPNAINPGWQKAVRKR